VFIDDATIRLMQLHFVPTESAFTYFEATRSYLEHHGKPVAFYSDKASIFRPVTKPEFGERGVTVQPGSVRAEHRDPVRQHLRGLTWRSTRTPCGVRRSRRLKSMALISPNSRA